MVISRIDSFFNGFLLGLFILPGPESDCRDVGTSVELESRRHFVLLSYYNPVEGCVKTQSNFSRRGLPL